MKVRTVVSGSPSPPGGSRLPARRSLARRSLARLPSVAAAAGLLSAAALTLASCFTSSEGLEPPTDQLYFPTGAALSPGGSTLYVASSDFDLQYNGGTVLALAAHDSASGRGMRSLALQVAAALEGQGFEAACGSVGAEVNDDAILHPGPCKAIDVAPFVRASAGIGAFASSAVVVAREGAPGARLFVPVRGDPSITWFDIVDDRDPAAPSSPCGDAVCLDCAGSGVATRCGPSHRTGELPYDNPRGLVLPVEPIGIAADPTGEALVVAHQTTTAASLLVNQWGRGTLRPKLQHVIGDLPEGPTGVGGVPVPRLVRASLGEDGAPTVAYAPTFLVTHSLAAELTLLRYEDDARSRPPRPFLTLAGKAPIGLGADGSDSRGVVVDGRERAACEASAGDADLDGLAACLDVPLRVYVANRSPASLVVGRIDSRVTESEGARTSVSDILRLEEIVPLSFGASNVVLGDVVGATGELEPRVFVVAFDSRFVFSYDPLLRRVDAVIRTGRGPHGVVADGRVDPATGEASSVLYVAHFTDSYLSVVDLDTRRASFGVPVLSVGPPVPPRESQ